MTSGAKRTALSHPDRLVHIVLIVGIFLCVFGGEITYVDHFGSDLPWWDQWDAEGEVILVPYFHGDLHVANFFRPHNEHRVACTRVVALGTFIANGQWDARLECVVNAAIHSALAVMFFLFGLGMIDRTWSLAWLATVLALSAPPFSWQNVTGGFHSQQIFLIGFSLAAISLLVTARPLTTRWWCGVACAVLAIFSMASGLLAAATAAGVLIVSGMPRQTFKRHRVTLIACALIVALGWKMLVFVPYHHDLRAQSVSDFLLCFWRSLQCPVVAHPLYPLLGWLPWTWFAIGVLRSGSEATSRDRVLFGAGAWTVLQYAATAFARGVHGEWPSSRYYDTVAIGVGINVLALLILLSRAHLDKWKKWLRAAAIALGVAWLVGGWWADIDDAIHVTGPSLTKQFTAGVDNTRAYLATGDFAHYAKGPLPYPGPEGLRPRIEHPEIQAVLPASVRPPIAMHASAGADSVTPTMGADGVSMFQIGAGSTVTDWRSAPLPVSRFSYWVMTVELERGSRDLKLSVVPEDGTEPVDLTTKVVSDGARHRVAFRAPRTPSRIVAHAEPPEKLAFSAPVEMATGSYWAWRVAHHGLIIATVGACLALGAVLWLSRKSFRLPVRLRDVVLPRWLRPQPTGYVVAAAVAIASFVALLPPRPEPIYFQAKLSATKGGIAELFYPDSRGRYHPQFTSRAQIADDGTASVSRFSIPEGSYIRLRLDPIGLGATTTIEDAKLLTAAGKIIRSIRPAEFHAEREITSMQVSASTVQVRSTPGLDDPQLVIPYDPPLRLGASWWQKLAHIIPAVAGGLLAGLIAYLGASRLVRSLRLQPPTRQSR